MVKTNTLLQGALWTAIGFIAVGCRVRTDEDIAAERGFRDHLGTVSITVYPACLRDGKMGRHHDGAASELAEFLNAQELAAAEASSEHVPLNAAASYSQTRIYAASIKEFRAYLHDHPIRTDYAALPEYLLDGRDRPIGVHAYVLRRDGAEAFGIILNSHHASFKSINPGNVDDATRVLVAGLRAALKKTEETK